MDCTGRLNTIIDKYYSRISVYSTKKKGRFREEINIEYFLKSKSGEKVRIGVLKVFSGRPPFYRGWVEVFALKPVLSIGGYRINFPGSVIEDALISCIAEKQGPGEWLYIEYGYDKETATMLEHGVLPVLTRLGFLLFRKGYTWFKDWYYPEGFMEGGPKLQAEKPINEKVKHQHIKTICREIAKWRKNVLFAKILKHLDTIKEVCLSVV